MGVHRSEGVGSTGPTDCMWCQMHECISSAKKNGLGFKHRQQKQPYQK